MTGGNILSIGETEYGIVPRAVQTIFKTLQVCLIYFLVRKIVECIFRMEKIVVLVFPHHI
jgi:hypothetical protein